MKNKKITLIFVILYLAELTALILFGVQTPKSANHTVAINDIRQSVEESWPDLLVPDLSEEIDYVIIDRDEKVLFHTKEGLNESVHSAISHQDLMVDIEKDHDIVGKLIVYNDQREVLAQQKKNIVIVLSALMAVQCLFGIGFIYYFEHTVSKPFYKLKNFAERVSQGNLDIPLEMDRGNLFGPFTESFDLMRTELKKARLAEALANAEKKELVAKLSHDIKTPVASIKATSELGLAITEEEKTKERFSQIIQKADQINTLTTNLFSATLEELQQLEVHPTEVGSSELVTLLKNADYLGKATFCELPECVIRADRLRLQQVFDNIFSNSYKYANTSISVSSGQCDKGIYIAIEDEGGGVLPEELPLLTQKFHRGNNASSKEGAGLGLYISDYFMKKMDGKLLVENGRKGLKVTVFLSLAGTLT